MHYYKRHLGDYAKKTAHLTPLEHGIYNLILDSYYDREQAPTLMEATRWARARTEEEKHAVLGILDEFFELAEDQRYHQQRVDDELAGYQKKASTNREVGKRGGRPKTQEETKTVSGNNPEETQRKTQTEPTENPNHKPLTNNHKNTPIPPAGGNDAPKKSRSAFSLKTYLAECKDAGVKPIPEDDSVFDYAAEAGITHEVLALHWAEFRARYSLPDAKKYKAWRTVFGKSVRGNWFKLWYFDQAGACILTTVGMQAKNAAAAAQRKAA